MTRGNLRAQQTMFLFHPALQRESQALPCGRRCQAGSVSAEGRAGRGSSRISTHPLRSYLIPGLSCLNQPGWGETLQSVERPLKRFLVPRLLRGQVGGAFFYRLVKVLSQRASSERYRWYCAGPSRGVPPSRAAPLRSNRRAEPSSVSGVCGADCTPKK